MSTRTRLSGFTLIEVMIVVAIIGILAAIAYPSYTESVRKGKRSEATAALMEGAQALERYYSINRSYQAGAVIAPVFLTRVPASGATYYTVAAVGNANSFTLTATPVNTMAGDECGNLTFSQTGAKGATGALGADICWRR